jgi:hypothetical protein
MHRVLLAISGIECRWASVCRSRLSNGGMGMCSCVDVNMQAKDMREPMTTRIPSSGDAQSYSPRQSLTAGAKAPSYYQGAAPGHNTHKRHNCGKLNERGT